MSSIASLFNVPGSISELNAWSFAHMAHHRDVNRRIYELTGIVLTEFCLEPINPADMGVWLDQHQVMHEQLDAVLSISGYDLLDVDWQDREQLAGWIFLNSDEHRQAADILEIG